MEPIAEVFRRERLRRGLELEQIAADTKISPYYLVAMEENRFDSLPGGLYTRNFVRQYAHALGLPDEYLIAAVKELEPAPLPDPPPPSKLEYLQQIPSFAWLLIALLGCGGIYTVWNNLHQPPIARRGDIPATIAVTEPSALEKSMPEIAKAAPALRRLDGIPGGRSASERTVPSMRIVFAAKEPVWLSIKADGVPVYTGTIDEEECKEIAASAKVNVLVGNAGGLVLSMNGSPVALTGAHGEVQSLVLTPSGVQVAPRIMPNAPTISIQSKDVSLSE